MRAGGHRCSPPAFVAHGRLFHQRHPLRRSSHAEHPQAAPRKHLIAGNNDPPATRFAAGWASVADYAELVAGGRLLILCQYPFRSWNGQAKGALNLHGPSHGRLKPLPRQIDVGVDAWDFAPVALETLLARASRRRSREPQGAPN